MLLRRVWVLRWRLTDANADVLGASVYFLNYP